MILCGQIILPASKGPMDVGKMHNINLTDFELPAKKVKSWSVHFQGQGAGDAFEKVSLLSGQK